MHRPSVLVGWLAILALLGCGSAAPPQTSQSCTIPDGCLGVDQTTGVCRCTDWKVVSDDVVPLKFLVAGVMIGAPGNLGGVTYGTFSTGTPPGTSQLGTRFRAVLVDGQGARTVLSAEVSNDSVGQFGLNAVGGRTVAVGMVPGDGISLSSQRDVYSPASDRVWVWVNPTLRLVKDAGGNLRGIWGWSGSCFWPPGANGGVGCSGPSVLDFEVAELDGTVQGPGFHQAFLQTLEPPELAAIRSTDRLASNPPPTTGDLDADPRFLRLGNLFVQSSVSEVPPTGWTPCASTAFDDDFPVFASTSIPVPGPATVVVEQSWVSTTSSCSTQSPGLAAATSTPDCEISSTAYVDRMFGTLAFVPGSASAACTTP